MESRCLGKDEMLAKRVRLLSGTLSLLFQSMTIREPLIDATPSAVEMVCYHALPHLGVISSPSWRKC